MFFVIPFGAPLGCIVGVLLVDRVILRLAACTTKKVLLIFMVVFLGMLIITSIRVITGYYGIPYLFGFFSKDVPVFSMPAIGAFCLLGDIVLFRAKI
jgi:hypothetical protein